ncbi:PEP-CTERM sorting domain-containing protein [Emcibacter sp. SYSU 3D8]|uniref:PEP-CTERM sorting domain-containing protein n=1 Tax=Emcibacter sp. SYSU 3D8 TaxID=3133969 RepID=UPI0031FF0D94
MGFVAAAFAVIVTTGAAQATPVNLISNGEFETPGSVTDYTIFPTNGVPGWGTTGSGIELWQQGFLGSPTTGSDGLSTGQSLELNANNGSDSVFQLFTVPLNITSSSAVLSFDAWPRQAALGAVSLVGTISGTILAPSSMAMNNALWTPNVFNVTVAAGETIRLVFQALGGNSAISPHVDQVAFTVDVPEPGALGLLCAGLMGLALVRRRRRSASF